MNTLNMIMSPAKVLFEEAMGGFIGLVTYRGESSTYWSMNLRDLSEFLATKNFLEGAEYIVRNSWDRLEELVKEYKEEEWFSVSPFNDRLKLGYISEHNERIESLEYQLCRQMWGTTEPGAAVNLRPYAICIKYLERAYMIAIDYFGEGSRFSTSLSIGINYHFPKLKEEMAAFEKFRATEDGVEKWNIWHDAANVRRIINAYNPDYSESGVGEIFEGLLKWGKGCARSDEFYRIALTALGRGSFYIRDGAIDFIAFPTTTDIIQACFKKADGMEP